MRLCSTASLFLAAVVVVALLLPSTSTSTFPLTESTRSKKREIDANSDRRGIRKQSTPSTSTTLLPNFEGLRECPHGTDDEINECLRLIIEDVRPFLAVGLPQSGIPPMEPLRLDEATAKVLGLDVKLTDIVVHGFSKFKDIEFKINSKRKSTEVYYAHEYLHMTTDYSVGGRLLRFIPLRFSGKLEVELWNYNANGTVRADIIRKRDGTLRWNITDADHHTDHMDKIRIRLPFLDRFGPLGRWLQTFINTNGIWLYKNLARPHVQKYVRNYLTSLDLDTLPAFLPVPPEDDPDSPFQWGR